MIRRVFMCLVLPLCAAACGTADRPSATGADSTRGVPIDPASPGGQIALELWQMRAGLTLGDWKAAHPDEPILATDTSMLANTALGEWCAYAAHRTVVDHDTLIRAAYFYAPTPPADLTIPDSGAPDLARRCVLGLVWVNVDARDSATAARIADSVKRRLATLYGAAIQRPPHFYGSAYWSRTARFRSGDLQIVTAVRGPNAKVAGPLRRNVTAFAFLPNAGITVDSGAGEAGPWSPTDTFPLDSAALLSKLDRSLYAPLQALVGGNPAGAGGVPHDQPPDSLIVPLSRWIAASAALPAPRRAAALYVADRVLERAMCSHRLCEDRASPALVRLRALGARFGWSATGGAVLYEHNWLIQARNLDRDSPLGQRILLAQLSAGFDLSGTCAGGNEAFRQVIENGERYLERVPDSPVAADVHFLVAEAYRDIVALARGAGSEWADSTKYQGEAEEAARKAIAHYAAATRGGDRSPASLRAWTRAWRLRAGLIPRDLRFYCVDD